ncbi:MAG: hypothetical protein ACYDCO_08925 [Armatimonadota bacterium]
MVQPYPQQAPQQASYPQQMPYPQQQPDGRVVSIGEWMLIMLVMLIPLINLIMVFVWAFSNDGSATKANYFKAMLIWSLIMIGLSILVGIIMAALGVALFNSDSFNY